MRNGLRGCISLIGLFGIGLAAPAIANQDSTPPSPGQAESPEELVRQRRGAIEQIRSMLVQGAQSLLSRGDGASDDDGAGTGFPFSFDGLLELIDQFQPDPIAGP